MPVAVEQKTAGTPTKYDPVNWEAISWLVNTVNPYGEGSPYWKIILGVLEYIAVASLLNSIGVGCAWPVAALGGIPSVIVIQRPRIETK